MLRSRVPFPCRSQAADIVAVSVEFPRLCPKVLKRQRFPLRDAFQSLLSSSPEAARYCVPRMSFSCCSKSTWIGRLLFSSMINRLRGKHLPDAGLPLQDCDTLDVVMKFNLCRFAVDLLSLQSLCLFCITSVPSKFLAEQILFFNETDIPIQNSCVFRRLGQPQSASGVLTISAPQLPLEGATALGPCGLWRQIMCWTGQRRSSVACATVLQSLESHVSALIVPHATDRHPSPYLLLHHRRRT